MKVTRLKFTFYYTPKFAEVIRYIYILDSQLLYTRLCLLKKIADILVGFKNHTLKRKEYNITVPRYNRRENVLYIKGKV